ncbi:hypothetical protein IAQ61_003578 [Plenodomus lingam]|uniref:uncharacterized protein n=1 Tax=Leptosphaeria maculans TaxID=5022 RepID=UPI0033244EB9|nr:hypothetical protein IAQ61_003578 [Plenodomus lingam]
MQSQPVHDPCPCCEKIPVPSGSTSLNTDTNQVKVGCSTKLWRLVGRDEQGGGKAERLNFAVLQYGNFNHVFTLLLYSRSVRATGMVSRASSYGQRVWKKNSHWLQLRIESMSNDTYGTYTMCMDGMVQ